VDVLEVVRDTVDLIRPLAAEREITVQAPSPQGTTFTVELPESSHRLLSGTPGRP
jgi:hypothetical protein